MGHPRQLAYRSGTKYGHVHGRRLPRRRLVLLDAGAGPVSVIAEIDNIVTDIAPDDNGVAIYRFDRGEMGILFNSSTQLAAGIDHRNLR